MSEGAYDRRRSARLRKLARWAGYLVAAACIAVMGVRVVERSSRIRDVEWRIGWQTPAAIGCVMCGQVASAGITYLWLLSLGAKPDWSRVMSIHLTAQPLKYLPIGGVFNLVGQTTGLGQLPGVGLPRAALAVGLMQAVVIAGGAAWYGVTLCLRSRDFIGLGMLLIGILPLMLLGVSRFRFWRAILLRRFMRNRDGEDHVDLRIGADLQKLVAIGLLALIAWGAFGLSLVLITSQLTVVSVETAIALSGAMAAAWLAGFLSMVAQAGIGVRDVTMMALLGPIVGDPYSVVVSVISRVLWTLADLCSFVVGILFPRLRSS